MARLTFAVAALALLAPLLASAPDVRNGRSAHAAAVLATPPADAAAIREQALDQGFAPLPTPPRVRPELVRLGRMLAFDPVLSGDRDIACMTCHHPDHATGDGLRLSVGTGGVGLGPQRQRGDGLVIGRNSPPLYNLHATDFLFHDGRVAWDGHGYQTPLEDALTPEMVAALEFGALSALPLLPVLERDEMRGFRGNELAALSSDEPGAIWSALMRRLAAEPEYVRLFEAAYPTSSFAELSFAHAANAISGFLLTEFAFADTPWDRFLAGDVGALSEEEMVGAQTFLDLACSECHSGPALSDGEFHDVALAQIGPGLGDGPAGTDDYGRYRVTGDPADRYAFRTPPLRNVELTAPYGHAGQFTDLRAFIAHYSESADALRHYAADAPAGMAVLDNVDGVLANRDPLLDGVVLSPEAVDALMAFMGALTDEGARDPDGVVPDAVPSGLPVAGGRSPRRLQRGRHKG